MKKVTVKSEIMLIVFFEDRWHVANGEMEVISGPYNHMDEAAERIKTMAWRKSQGWSI